MRLEMASFPVRRAELGARTTYADGLLTIDAGAIRRLVLRDTRIADVQLELIHPGESTRVLRVLDAVEPLAKVAGPSTAFPEFLGPPLTCGAGRTHRLAGFAVVQVTEFPFPARGVQAFEEGIVEMSGPGAVYSGCVPLDAARDPVERGEIGSLLETYYVAAGNHGILGRMTRYGREIASELLAQSRRRAPGRHLRIGHS
jgi:hypothetical protein